MASSSENSDPLVVGGGPVLPVGVSATLAANEILMRRRRAGEQVLPMAFGEAGLPVHSALRRELSAASTQNAYGPVAGIQELREAAAGYWRRRRLITDADQVVCGPGSKALLFGLLLTIGGDVVVPVPSWVSYAAQAHMVGAVPLFVRTIPGEGGVPDPDALADRVSEARAAGRPVRSIIVTLPDNPTGRIAAAPTIQKVCEAARALDLVIISDEIYRDLVFDTDTETVSPAEYAPERTVITTALSKSLALGGWRIGISRFPDSAVGRKLRDGLLGVVSEIWSSPSCPIQMAAAYAFSEPAEITERVTASRRLHSVVAHAVAERFTAAGAQLALPQAGFYVYPDFEPVRDQLQASFGVRRGTDLSGLLLDRFGVGALAASKFGEMPRVLRLRFATALLYGDTEEEREESLDAIDPLALPWVKGALDRLDAVLADLTTGARATPAAAVTA